MSAANERLHSLDAVRAFALLLGVVFHAGFSFIPGLPPGVWAINDASPSAAIGVAVFTSHVFRMSLFFFIAGFFARLIFQRRGARGFWSDRLKRILGPLLVGWIVIFPTIAALWVWGLRKTFGNAPLPQMPQIPQVPLAFPLTHLWFLYYLLILYAAVVGVRSIVAALDRSGRVRQSVDRVVRGLVRSNVAVVLLGLPLAAALYFNEQWILWLGIPTPDRSLLPELVSLTGYGTAVAFGWLMHRQSDLFATWAARWHVHLAAAVLLTGACMAIVGLRLTLTPVPQSLAKLGYALCYCLALWCWVFAITGMSVRFLSGESPLRRYVADSSYWLYIAHLPVVVALQIAVGRLSWHWSIKFAFILAASFAVLFLSYHYLVRFTFLGQALNGRKHERSRKPAAPDAGIDKPVAAALVADQSCLAELRGVHKSYGKTIALDGLDLQVGGGELLAVLGPNGAGKSTAIGLWLGLIEPDRGSVRLMGGSPLDIASRRGIGVMMQDVALEPTLKVRELVELAASYYPNPLTAREALELTHTTELAERRYAKLSGGQKRQAQFAIAVCGRPRLLFLDEPTVGLDVQARETMWDVIRALIGAGCAVVLTTHYLEEAEALANRVVVLAKGKVIAAGSVEQVRSVVGHKRVVCSTNVDVEEVRTWPDVVLAWRESSRLHITASNAEAIVRRLLAADASLANLEVRPAGLADAFVELTREAA
jgi:ABC-type multidrug transport system ATPase subunit/peptidoglycan/LPS O-acetylase OafA/YrhL